MKVVAVIRCIVQVPFIEKSQIPISFKVRSTDTIILYLNNIGDSATHLNKRCYDGFSINRVSPHGLF